VCYKVRIARYKVTIVRKKEFWDKKSQLPFSFCGGSKLSFILQFWLYLTIATLYHAILTLSHNSYFITHSCEIKSCNYYYYYFFIQWQKQASINEWFENSLGIFRLALKSKKKKKKHLHFLSSIHFTIICIALFTTHIQKIHESTLQCTVICYQRRLTELCVSKITASEKRIN